MSRFVFCPYLNSNVELTDEREAHIISTHPGTLPDYIDEVLETIKNPDQIRHSERDSSALLFSKWFDTIRTGRYLVVVIVVASQRPWIITIYTARKLSKGNVIWQKN
jgi:hypothetical protein